MRSMTGFGRSTQHDATLEITVEINSVNRKSLDIAVSLPREWQGLEASLLECCRSKLLRGKVSVYLQARVAGRPDGLNCDFQRVSAALSTLRELAAANAVAFEPDADLLLRLVTTVNTSSALPDGDECWPLIETALLSALTELDAMRAAEGAALLSDVVGRVEWMQGIAAAIQKCAASVVPQYRELLRQRLNKAGLELNLDDERVLKEIALFADRCDISEEITRLSSHFEQFLATAQAQGAVGRKLDFICQEINREVNTIGSKANNLEITRHVIECKNELERIREQVQNVE